MSLESIQLEQIITDPGEPESDVRILGHTLKTGDQWTWRIVASLRCQGRALEDHMLAAKRNWKTAGEAAQDLQRTMAESHGYGVALVPEVTGSDIRMLV